MNNCIVIGNNSFADGDNQVIIGDNIKGTDTKQRNVLILGRPGRVVIGRTLFGEPINLRSLIERFIATEADALDIGSNLNSLSYSTNAGGVEAVKDEPPRYRPIKAALSRDGKFIKFSEDPESSVGGIGLGVLKKEES